MRKERRYREHSHPPPTMQSTYCFTWGRYRGRELWHVTRADPEYIAWLRNNLEGFSLAMKALKHYASPRDRGY